MSKWSKSYSMSKQLYLSLVLYNEKAGSVVVDDIGLARHSRIQCFVSSNRVKIYLKSSQMLGWEVCRSKLVSLILFIRHLVTHLLIPGATVM